MDFKLDNYRLLRDSENSRIFQVTDDSAHLELILKQSLTTYSAQIHNEVRLFQLVYPECNARLVLNEGMPSMVRSFIAGESLLNKLKGKPLSIEEFFDHAQLIIRSLEHVHNKGVIHKDINPSNILFNSNGECMIIDLDIATQINNEMSVFSPITEIEGNASYISPEQTGRMNRVVDFRSDYYSLGCTFYCMLSGAPPFENDDLLELVHSHLAIEPRSLSDKEEKIPEYLSKVIDKLLEKNAESRYQSLETLKSDLEKCRSFYEGQTSPENFMSDSNESRGKLTLSTNFYGREQELETLTHTFESLHEDRNNLILIEGEGGMGKSRLVRELYRPLTKNDGLFFSSLFDPVRTSIPFYPWREILSDFANWLLSENETVRNEWIERIEPVMSKVGGYLIDLCPEMALLTTEKWTSPEAIASERRQGLGYAISEIVECWASNANSIVLFIDDWQWSDAGSCDVLESLFNSSNLSGLNLILAYRETEAMDNTSFQNLRNQFFNARRFVLTKFNLTPLNSKAIEEMLNDTFGERELNAELASVLKDHTSGNPFSIENALMNLHNAGKIHFDSDTKHWAWSIEEIRTELLKDNSAEFDAIGKLENFSDNGQAILNASALGVQFSLSLLSELLGKDELEIHKLLEPAIINGWIIPDQNNYKYTPEYYAELKMSIDFKFTHARIQEAFYSILSESDKKQLHKKASERMVNSLNENKDDDFLFRLAQHITEAKEEIRNSDFQVLLLSALRRAGIRSYQLAAFDNAVSFLTNQALLETRETNTGLYNAEYASALIQSCFFTGLKNEALKYHESALSEFTAPLDIAEIHYAQMQCLLSEAKIEQAVDYARIAFKSMGLNIPKKANIIKVIIKSLQTAKKLPKNEIETISELPQMEEQSSLALMKLTEVALSPYFLTNLETYPLLLFNMVKLSVEKGVTSSSVIGFGSYGLIVAAMLKKPEEGYRIGLQALKLADRFDVAWARSPANFVHGLFIGHWKEPQITLVDYAEKGIESGISSGNMEYAGWNMMLKILLQIGLGSDYKLLLQEGEKALDFQARNNLETQKCKTLAMVELLRNMNINDQPSRWDVMSDELSKELEKSVEIKDDSSVFTVHYYRLIYHYVIGERDLSWEDSKLSGKDLKSVIGTHNYVLNLFFTCLSGLHQLSKSENRSIKRKVLKNHKKLKQLCDLNPVHQGTLLRFVDLEISRLNTSRYSIEDYQALLEELLKHDLFLFAIILCEIVSDILKNEDPVVSQHWLMNARELAITINAAQIVRYLDTKKVASKSLEAIDNTTSQIRSNDTIKGADLDMITLIKSASAIGSEINLSDLIKNLLDFTMENAGAQRGLFIVRRQGVDVVHTEIALSKDQKEYDNLNQPLESYDNVAKSVINYCSNTNKEVVVNDAIEESPYNDDKYIIANKSKSILCIPIIHMGKINSFIYLENSLIKDAFTMERTSFVKLLTSQVAASIESAFVKNNLENIVANRTEKLLIEKEKSDKLLSNVLPNKVAEELKLRGKTTAKRFENATVFFSDICGFTSAAEEMSPEELVKELDYCFKAYDDILKKYKIEKIKTIGDAYFCVSGVPEEIDNSAEEMLNFAFDIVKWMNDESERRNGNFFQIRIGIHSGPVVAGVIGNYKFAYDVWGDTVNVGARMEQNGEPNRINISESTYQKVKNTFNCSPRGEIHAKNKGMLDMYFVEGKKEQNAK